METGRIMRNPREESALRLAYMGDAVYEVYIRRWLMEQSLKPVGSLHKESVQFVKASAQAAFYHLIEPKLTEGERAVMRRGRNAKSAMVPRKADINDYRKATGFEALIGFLYLNGEMKRLEEVMGWIFQETQNGLAEETPSSKL